jgi:hypothetical protein
MVRESIDNFEYWEKRTFLAKILTKINTFLVDIFPRQMWGFCLHCYKFTFNLHDSSDQSWHCPRCCWIEELVSKNE